MIVTLRNGSAPGSKVATSRAQRQVERNLAIEPSRTKQCRVEDIGSIGRREYQYRIVRRESIHGGENQVQRLLALIVPASETSTPRASDRVDLVDEDDSRRLLLRALEQIPHARGTHTDEHLDELGPADREEGNLGFTRDRLCK